MMQGKPVMVAMSGGVDSAVAAALLMEQGYDVVGVTMKLWGGDSDTGCCSVSDVLDARRAADIVGIDHHVFNFGDDFDEHVVAPYVEAHAQGYTPNPCIECNRSIKFDRLLERADALGFEHIATGHHARIAVDGDMRYIERGADGGKDQSYVLHTLGQAELARTLFPIGHMSKDEVRAKAADIGMRVANKPDSQDVCFITRAEGRSNFLRSRMDFTPGDVVNASGESVGAVEAVQLVTIGQRKGLGTAGGGRTPRYVIDVDVPQAKVIIGEAHDLLVEETAIGDFAWTGGVEPTEVMVQTSAHGNPGAASVTVLPDADQPTGPGGSLRRILLSWTEARSRVAPGQSVVLYSGNRVIGGGLASR